MLAEVFEREGVTTYFALYGGGNMDWGTTLADLGTNMFYVRHERAVVAAACSYARKTGDVGGVTCGPGLSQLMTALPAAVRANLPLVVFTAKLPSSRPGTSGSTKRHFGARRASTVELLKRR